MTKQLAETTLVVEPTKFGWSVRINADQLGLFTTQQHAIDAAGKCQVKMKAKGRTSTISIIGFDREPVGQPSRTSWRRRR
jgi:hypothetical protein